MIVNLLMLWIGGVIGGAVIGLLTDQEKGHTFARAFLLLCIWPLIGLALAA